MLERLRKELRDNADPGKAKILMGFFKTGPGEYGHGDIFLGIVVPKQRLIAGRYLGIPLKDCRKLLSSVIHEERLVGLIILVEKFRKGQPKERKEIFELYLRNSRRVNNWDLVDLSAPHIVGEFLLDKPKGILLRLARSQNLWERRIAIVSTFAYIRRGQPGVTLKVARMLLDDRHDLIHKACGWMLREVGKRCSRKSLEDFLKRYCRRMPRTMLRYSLEHFPKSLQKAYLNT